MKFEGFRIGVLGKHRFCNCCKVPYNAGDRAYFSQTVSSCSVCPSCHIDCQSDNKWNVILDDCMLQVSDVRLKAYIQTWQEFEALRESLRDL